MSGLTDEQYKQITESAGWSWDYMSDHERGMMRAVADAAVPSCEWFPASDMDNMPDTWEGACGAIWSFIDDGPIENGMRFCPNCGGKVVIAAKATGDQ